MRYLGRTGLAVSALSFGSMTFGADRSDAYRPLGETGQAAADRQVAMCIDAGVNLFDTADVYADGTSEEILGRALGARRPRVLLATKLHGRMGDGANDLGQSRHHVIAACEASLRRLGTDWIDLLQVHSIDTRTDPAETLRALDDLVRSGKVRYVGCSNFAAWHLMRALAVSDREHLVRYSALQAHYSLLSREAELELVPLCLDQGLGLLVWSPLSGGFLTGKVRRDGGAPAGSRGAAMPPPGGLPDPDRAYAIVDELAAIAERRAVSPAQVALNWLLAKPGVTSLVIGARTDEQLADNLAAAGWRLDPEEVARLDAVSAARLPYPQWHQLRYNAERMDEPWARERPARGEG